MNTIRLLMGETKLSKTKYEKSFNKGDTIWGENSEPEELKRWSIEDEKEAKEELKKYKCSYDESIELYYITEYALEYFEADEEGEFLTGSDFEIAERE